MGDWQSRLQRDLQRAVARAGLSTGRAGNGSPYYPQHLAILSEPYLEWILSGRKTIESRFSVNRVAPYGLVRPGDRLLLKRVSGPVLGLCAVSKVAFFELDEATRSRLRERYSKALCAEDPAFWRARERASYATLMYLEDVHRLAPIPCGKRDRRGWVVMPEVPGHEQFSLPSDRSGRPDRERQV